MWKSDKNETFDVLFILFDVLIFVAVINYSFSTFWSTKKPFLTFWFRSSEKLKRQFRSSDQLLISTFWNSTFRPPPILLWKFLNGTALVPREIDYIIKMITIIEHNILTDCLSKWCHYLWSHYNFYLRLMYRSFFSWFLTNIWHFVG
jgi:hypothetical protein